MMYRIVLLSLCLCKSYAQLTSPDEAVCVRKQVVFVCQQSGSPLRWTVVLPGGVSNQMVNSVTSSQNRTVVSMFGNDPGFGFEIYVLSSSSDSSINSELRVTAVRELNGTTVKCTGLTGSFMSTLQISSANPPAAPSGVMTTADQSQFTPSTASITLTWSASSEADNYTIMVTPLLPSEQSLVSTTTARLQLTVLYNEEYSINITAQNCAGSNSTIVSLTVVGCSPPSPPANGSISEYSSGAVGAMLTFQCDTGYMPQEEVTSTCLPNNSWVPIPECQVINCGAPFVPFGVFINPFNDTIYGSLITFHCEESTFSITAICTNDGEWTFNQTSKCENDMHTDMISMESQVIISTIICSLVFLLLGTFLGGLIIYCFMRYKVKFKVPMFAPPVASTPVVYEEVSPDSHNERKNDIELNENVAYGPVTK